MVLTAGWLDADGLDAYKVCGVLGRMSLMMMVMMMMMMIKILLRPNAGHKE